MKYVVASSKLLETVECDSKREAHRILKEFEKREGPRSPNDCESPARIYESSDFCYETED